MAEMLTAVVNCNKYWYLINWQLSLHLMVLLYR